MKHLLRFDARRAMAASALAFVAILGSAALSAQTPVTEPDIPVYYQGVGPAVAGSVSLDNLPKEARHFLNRHFKDAVVSRVMEEYAGDRGYEVSMTDGTDVEFDTKGQWTEVDAGNGLVIPQHLVKELLPEKARRELEKRGVVAKVETVKRADKGYKVELRDVELDDYRFASDGKLLSVTD